MGLAGRFFILLSFLLIPAGNALLAQTRSISLELGGSAGLASINYEKTFREAGWGKEKGKTSDGESECPSLLNRPRLLHSSLKLAIGHFQAFREATRPQLAYRIGLSGFPIDRNSGMVFVLPFALQARWGTGPHKLEAAMGFSLSFTTRVKVFSQAIPAIGYRYQADDKRIFYKITYTPLISFWFNWQYQHWAGITIGYDL